MKIMNWLSVDNSLCYVLIILSFSRNILCNRRLSSFEVVEKPVPLIQGTHGYRAAPVMLVKNNIAKQIRIDLMWNRKGHLGAPQSSQNHREYSRKWGPDPEPRSVYLEECPAGDQITALGNDTEIFQLQRELQKHFMRAYIGKFRYGGGKGISNAHRTES